MSEASVIAERANLFAEVKRQLHSVQGHTECADNALHCHKSCCKTRYEKTNRINGSFLFALVRTTGLVVSEASVIAERANLFAEVIVYAQRFVASNNATHSCDKSHNRWLCPLRSISANASACFSLRLRSAAHRAGANKRSVVCRQNVVLFQVRCRMKKDNPFGLSFFGYHIRNSYNFISIYCPSFLNATCHSLTILSNLSFSLFIYNENYFGPTCLYNVSSGCSTVV